MTHRKLLSAFLVLLPFSVHASQVLNCTFLDGLSADRIRVTILDSQNGTFLYETADPAGNGSTEALKLKRTKDPEPGVAAFEIQSTAVRMTVKIGMEHLFQNGIRIPILLLSQIPEMDLSQEQSLTCDSVVK